MERFHPFLVLGVLFGTGVIATTTESNINTSQVANSVSRLLENVSSQPPYDSFARHMDLVTSVRTVGNGMKSKLKGGIDGQIDTSFGDIDYRGTFGGFYSPSRANLHLHALMNGTQNLKDSRLKYTRKSNGKVVFRTFRRSFTFNIEADDTTKLKGVSHGKSITGNSTSKIRVFVFKGKRPSYLFSGEGNFRFYIDKKLLEGKYYVSGTKTRISFEVGGTNGGKPFFANEKSTLKKHFETLKYFGIGGSEMPKKLGTMRNHGEGWIDINGMRMKRKFDQHIPLDAMNKPF